MPNVEFFRDCMEFIDEYAPRLYGGIEKHIQTKLIDRLNQRLENLESGQDQKLSTLENGLNQRVTNFENQQNQRLSTLEGKQNQKPQRQYSAVCRIQNHLSYKLGSALIKASKNWYKGGFIKLIFEINKIKKEHKK